MSANHHPKRDHNPSTSTSSTISPSSLSLLILFVPSCFSLRHCSNGRVSDRLNSRCILTSCSKSNFPWKQGIRSQTLRKSSRTLRRSIRVTVIPSPSKRMVNCLEPKNPARMTLTCYSYTGKHYSK